MHNKPLACSTAETGCVQGDDSLDSFFLGPGNSVDARGLVQNYPAQVVIFKQDTPAHTVYLIERGLVKLIRIAPNGRQMITGLRRSPWLIGAPAVLLDKPYSFTAVTLFPSSLRCIPAMDFLDLAKSNEQFSWRLHRLLSQEIFNQMKKVEAMSCMSAQDRLMRFLSDLTDEQNRDGPRPAGFSLPLSNQELAQLIAVTPEHLCRVMKRMEQKGLIRREMGMLTVTDPAGLMQKAAP
jgi:CRP/FNR family transcriptional regulator, dissimilatory nitrate respiration regulator